MWYKSAIANFSKEWDRGHSTPLLSIAFNSLPRRRRPAAARRQSAWAARNLIQSFEIPLSSFARTDGRTAQRFSPAEEEKEQRRRSSHEIDTVCVKRGRSGVRFRCSNMLISAFLLFLRCHRSLSFPPWNWFPALFSLVFRSWKWWVSNKTVFDTDCNI